MIFAAILAGGKGTRMGNQDRPKQYLSLCGKPILIYTIEKFLVMSQFEKIIVLAPEAWGELTKDIIAKYFGENERLIVLPGGPSRNETIMNAISYIETHYSVDDTYSLLTHDSVRPFVTYRIIEDNIKAMDNYDACDTVIPATDTIVCSSNGKTVSEIPNRSAMYQGQTPQTFKIFTLKSLYNSLSNEEKNTLTDACKICVLKNTPVALVQGETFNIKITYPSDLKMAQALLGSGE